MPQELKTVEDRLASYLKFSPDEAPKFTHYTFDSHQTEHWDILGIHYINKNPLLIDVRLMYIDQDAREWEDFRAERDASGYITFNPVRYLTIIPFFEMLLDGQLRKQEKAPHYFSLLNREELQQLHYSADATETLPETYYRYTYDQKEQDSDMIHLVRFPRWSQQYGAHQISALWFTSFPQHYLNNAQFDLENDTDSLSTLQFNQRALEEFILLLKKHRL